MYVLIDCKSLPNNLGDKFDLDPHYGDLRNLCLYESLAGNLKKVVITSIKKSESLGNLAKNAMYKTDRRYIATRSAIKCIQWNADSYFLKPSF